jgi:hypothetical protein
MITIEKHLENNEAEIHAAALLYAKNYNVSYKIARRDVEDEYCQGWHESRDAMRNGDWDYGRE